MPPPSPLPGARLLFSIDPSVSYLNHGSFGAVPVPVQRAQQRLRDEMETNPHRFFAVGLLDRVGHVRRHLAAFLGADPQGCALVRNVTAGVALAVEAVAPGAGDEILVTDHGYGAVAMEVARRCREAGAAAVTVPVPLDASDDETVAALRAAVTNRTRLAIVDHVSSATARLFPVGRIVAALREAGVPTLVDGAHAPGMLPLSLDTVDADFWVGNLHKWAFAPRGTGLLCVAPRWRDSIRPPAVSWQHDVGYPLAVEFQGTDDYTAWLAAPVGVYMLRTLGMDTVRAHNVGLAAYGQQIVASALGVDIAALPASPGVSMRVVPLPADLATTMAEATALRLLIAEKLGIEVAVNAWRRRGYLRLSGQVYNRAEEYERLADQLPVLLAAVRARAAGA